MGYEQEPRVVFIELTPKGLPRAHFYLQVGHHLQARFLSVEELAFCAGARCEQETRQQTASSPSPSRHCRYQAVARANAKQRPWARETVTQTDFWVERGGLAPPPSPPSLRFPLVSLALGPTAVVVWCQGYGHSTMLGGFGHPLGRRPSPHGRYQGSSNNLQSPRPSSCRHR